MNLDRRVPQGIYPNPERTQRFRATGEFRPPLQGEWFLSGALVEAYKVRVNLSTPYWIAKPILRT